MRESYETKRVDLLLTFRNNISKLFKDLSQEDSYFEVTDAAVKSALPLLKCASMLVCRSSEITKKKR